jgi:hypothetical protein
MDAGFQIQTDGFEHTKKKETSITSNGGNEGVVHSNHTSTKKNEPLADKMISDGGVLVQ